MAIDYARMNRVHPRQKAALTRAVKSRSAASVVLAVRAAVVEWGAIGAGWGTTIDDLARASDEGVAALVADLR